MPYVPFNAGEIGGQYAAQIGAQTAQAMNETQQNALKTKQEVDMLSAKANALASTRGPDGQPLLTADQLHKFMAGSLSTRRQIVNEGEMAYGMAAQVQQQEMTAERLRQQGMLNQEQIRAIQTRNAGELQGMTQRQDYMNHPNAATPVYDANGNLIVTNVRQSPWSSTAIKSQQPAAAVDPNAVPVLKKGKDGNWYLLQSNGNWTQTRAPGQGNAALLSAIFGGASPAANAAPTPAPSTSVPASSSALPQTQPQTVPAAAPAPTPVPANQHQSMLNQARQAISNGASREGVIARLQKLGVPVPAGF